MTDMQYGKYAIYMANVQIGQICNMANMQYDRYAIGQICNMANIQIGQICNRSNMSNTANMQICIQIFRSTTPSATAH